MTMFEAAHRAELGARASEEPLGPRWRWARDFAVIGAASSFLAPCLIVGDLLGPSYLALCTFFVASTASPPGQSWFWRY